MYSKEVKGRLILFDLFDWVNERRGGCNVKSGRIVLLYNFSRKFGLFPFYPLVVISFK